MELPEEFCKRNKIKAGTALRVTEVGGGLYVAPVAEPSIKDLKSVIAAAGSLFACETLEDEEMVRQAITQYRMLAKARATDKLQ